MPGFFSRSSNAAPMWLTDDDGNSVGTAANPIRTQTTSGTGAAATQVQGTSASNAADDGSNPVKVGGVYRATRTSVTDGRRTDQQMSAFGDSFVVLSDANGNKVPSDGTNGLSITVRGPGGGNAYCLSNDGDNTGGFVQGLVANAFNRYWNGNGWDRARGDVSGVFIGANQFWTESTTALAASATLVGTLRANGGTAGGVGSRFSFFIAEAFSDVAGGTLFVDKSTDAGTTWRQVGSIALVANTSVTLKVPLSAASYRARVVNGTAAQGAALVTTALSLN